MRQMKQREAQESIDAILKLIGLIDHQHTWAKNLSGGMKRRLSIGISLVGDPKVNIHYSRNLFQRWIFLGIDLG